jgi:hypothetical protein
MATQRSVCSPPKQFHLHSSVAVHSFN